MSTLTHSARDDRQDKTVSSKLTEFSSEQLIVIERAVRSWDGTYGIVRAVEELAELIVALTHDLRKRNKLDKLHEEMADVSLVLKHLEYRFGSYQGELDIKVERLQKELTGEVVRGEITRTT